MYGPKAFKPKFVVVRLSARRWVVAEEDLIGGAYSIISRSLDDPNDAHKLRDWLADDAPANEEEKARFHPMLLG